MSVNNLFFNRHGGKLHSTAIAICTMIADERGYKILNGRAFKDKYRWPGEPDLYIEVNESRTDTHGRKTKWVQRYVIEIESNPTKESIAKKYAQFEISSPGNKLIVISLMDNNFHDPLSDLWKYLEDMMP